MFLQTLDLTTALRPELLSDETLLFVQDGVGLYEGKYKLPNYQHGHLYLTSHRICYVDNAEPRRHSTAIPLKLVDRYEYYAGFLKSSAKVTVYPKAGKRSSLSARAYFTASPLSQSPSRSDTNSPFPRHGSPSSNLSPVPPPPPKSSSVTWVCPICSFSNSLPPSFDATSANEHTVLPPCQTCGIKPPLAHLLKAAIASAAFRSSAPSNEAPSQPLLESHGQYRAGSTEYNTSRPISGIPRDAFRCPRCTFENHASLLACEICGASLVSTGSPTASGFDHPERIDSPGPSLGPTRPPEDIVAEYIKISFRTGGDKIFHERLKAAMVQRKWLLENAPVIPAPHSTSDPSTPTFSTPEPSRGVGIAGLERLHLSRQRNNETVISSAFSDLEALMASAKEIIALAESFAGSNAAADPSAARLLNDSATGLGMTMTKDMLDGSGGAGEELYLSELSRTLAEYLTDDRQAILKRSGGIIALVDLWAAFNRARNGVELVSPGDFEKAARSWEKLGLPVRLREFKNGLLVVQRHDWTDDKTIAQFVAWFQEFHEESAWKESVGWDQSDFGRGVTAQEAAAKFGWSVGVATEELEMAEEKGVLCREEGIEGLKFWENFMDDETLSLVQ